ncbi:zinc-ribbon domain-containing protein [Chitinophaga barathri]|uniref:zinc-ribbon domain-containing protein n=1 Tax=Chitinophaga barathri TaxID=1647451 RepID=UPI00240D61A0|nr:zinc-ribbon domain-containing protein [Chitinophaga barathri]
MHTDCPVCNSSQHAEVMVYSEYVHVYYIPFFPVGKDAFTVCSQCGFKKTTPLTRGFCSAHSLDYRKYRHPMRTFSGLLTIGGLIGLTILVYQLD